jgi:predicted FMN-binding regulatory protein PaiB
MYIPEHFRAGGDQELHALITAHPLGALVTQGPNGLDANHIPFELDAQPWKMSDAPKDYLDEMVKAIVGIEVEITRLAGKFKLSQNREARDIAGVIGQLEERGDQALARAMAEGVAKRDS